MGRCSFLSRGPICHGEVARAGLHGVSPREKNLSNTSIPMSSGFLLWILRSSYAGACFGWRAGCCWLRWERSSLGCGPCTPGGGLTWPLDCKPSWLSFGLRFLALLTGLLSHLLIGLLLAFFSSGLYQQGFLGALDNNQRVWAAFLWKKANLIRIVS